jgi:citrate synthase
VSKKPDIVLDGNRLTRAELVAVARHGVMPSSSTVRIAFSTRYPVASAMRPKAA